MRSDERRFRREYDRYWNEDRNRERDRDRSRSGDRDYDYTGRREYRNFENRSGYGNRSTPNRFDEDRERYTANYRNQDEYEAPYYDRIHEPREERYDRRDYGYDYGREEYGQRQGYGPDYRSNRYESESPSHRIREARPGYHKANYENPENSDSRRERRGPDFNRGRSFQAQRNKWDSHNINSFDQRNLGMERYQARDRNETLYGGITELNNTRDHNPSPDRGDKGFIERTGDRIRSYFKEEEEPRVRSKNWERVGR